jgi:hypothetical protein
MLATQALVSPFALLGLPDKRHLAVFVAWSADAHEQQHGAR